LIVPVIVAERCYSICSVTLIMYKFISKDQFKDDDCFSLIE
jgi:hypothetical protein